MWHAPLGVRSAKRRHHSLQSGRFWATVIASSSRHGSQKRYKWKIYYIPGSNRCL